MNRIFSYIQCLVLAFVIGVAAFGSLFHILTFAGANRDRAIGLAAVIGVIIFLFALSYFFSSVKHQTDRLKSIETRVSRDSGRPLKSNPNVVEEQRSSEAIAIQRKVLFEGDYMLITWVGTSRQFGESKSS